MEEESCSRSFKPLQHTTSSVNDHLHNPIVSFILKSTSSITDGYIYGVVEPWHNIRDMLSVYWPCNAIAINLQEAKEVLSLLSITGLLLGCQCVIGHQQRMCSPTWNHKRPCAQKWFTLCVRADGVKLPEMNSFCKKKIKEKERHSGSSARSKQTQTTQHL